MLDDNSTALILQKFELDHPERPIPEEELFEVLSNQIAYMIEYKIDFLLSLLYRMDVPEHQINFALSPHCTEPANIALAKLVMERQKAKMFTKKEYDVNPIEDLEEGLEW